jgi:SpoVK/Ycf46/Vps4 family AAA+-type ATPase
MLTKLDEAMVEQIRNSMIDNGPGVSWEDIIGLKDVKATLTENIVSP